MTQKTHQDKPDKLPEGVVADLPVGSNQKEILLFILELADGKSRHQVPWSYPPRTLRGESSNLRARRRIAVTRSLCKLERRGLVVRHRRDSKQSSPTVGVELTLEGWRLATQLRDDARQEGPS